VPAYFSRDLFDEVSKSKGDVGARQLLLSADGISMPGGELDIDTADDLARARIIFG
jgi:molybdenum cofactor cytidylyltransferase